MKLVFVAITSVALYGIFVVAWLFVIGGNPPLIANLLLGVASGVSSGLIHTKVLR